MTAEELEEFINLCPVVAEMLFDPNVIQKVPPPKIDHSCPIYDTWDKAAKRLVNQIWRSNGAHIFHNPIDPDRLGIPDYFEVIKEPIDLGTIKQRLNHNSYFTMQEVVDDIWRCFDNCIEYNGEDSPAGERCMQVIKAYEKAFEQLNIKFYLEEIPLNTPLD